MGGSAAPDVGHLFHGRFFGAKAFPTPSASMSLMDVCSPAQEATSFVPKRVVRRQWQQQHTGAAAGI
jgi:hypothetical protein